MNEEENHLHPLGIYHKLLSSITKIVPKFTLKFTILGCFGMLICHKLFELIVQTLEAHAIKSVTLGPSTPSDFAYSEGAFTRPEGESGGATTSENSVTEMPRVQENGGVTFSSHDTAASGPHATAIEARAPKKTVSINENVEEIVASKKSKRKKRKVEELYSMQKGKEGKEVKPLKSILKVRSDVNEKWDK